MTHFVTTQYPGYLSYAGYPTQEEAMKQVASKQFGSDFEREYIGETLTFEAMEGEISSTEKEMNMPALLGSEKQIRWARQIRYRFYYYLVHRYSEPEANERFFNEQRLSADLAGHYLVHRYSFAVTSQESKYVAEGKGDIWTM